MSWIIDTVMANRGFNDGYTFSFYFVPVILNLICGVLRFFCRIEEDLEAREKYIKKLADKTQSNYDHHSYLMIGDAVEYLLGSVCPVVSMWLALFTNIPFLWSKISKRFEWLFNIRFIKVPK